MINSQERNKAIDFAKGVAIILMVFGHCYSKNNFILQLIYAFHMPFFFIVSGVLYSGRRDSIAVQKSFRRLIIPYLIFETLFVALLTLLSRSNDMFGFFYESVLKKVLSGVGVTATWYLPCNFIVLILFVCINRVIKNDKIQIIAAVVFMAIGLCAESSGYMIVLCRAFVGLGFFGIGFYFNDIFIVPKKNSFIIIASALYIYLANVNGMVSLVNMNFSNPFLYIANGILGTFVLIQISLKVKYVRFERIQIVGKNSITILCMHMILIEVIRLLDYKLLSNFLPKLGYMEGIVFGIIVIVLIYPIIPIYNKDLKFLFGK